MHTTIRLQNAIAIGMVFLTLFGCKSIPDDQVIHLSNLQLLPTVASNDIVPLRVAIAAVISPQGTVEGYQPLLDYISMELGRPIELIQRRTYSEVNDLIERGTVDIAVICTSAYVEGKRDFDMELVAAPLINGEPVYYSLLIAPSSSPAQSIADLRGRVFAFTDPISTTGRVYPTYLVQELGTTPDEFFARTFFTYSHDDAIRAVANGVADGAAVDSLVFEFALDQDPSLANTVRIIHRSPAFASPPIVVGPYTRPQLKAELQDLLFNLPESPEGRLVLEALGIEQFVPIDDAAYDSVRELIDAVGPLVLNEDE